MGPALVANPKTARLWLLQAKVLGLQERWDEAEKALEKALEIEPGSQSAYMMLAGLHVRRGKPKESIRRLEELLAKSPTDIGPWILAALIHEQGGELEKARSAYEAALKIKPDSVAVLNNLAYLLAERLDRVDKAPGTRAQGRSPGAGRSLCRRYGGLDRVSPGKLPRSDEDAHEGA